MDHQALLLRVREILGELTGAPVQEITEKTHLFGEAAGGLDLDSLESLKMALALSEEYGIDYDLSFADYQLATVGEVAKFIAHLANGESVRTEGES
jgi:acyl carrier protein